MCEEYKEGEIVRNREESRRGPGLQVGVTGETVMP